LVADFDVDAFLAQPLTARLATMGMNGPAVRPVWFLWEDGCFWWLTGPWSQLDRQLARDLRVTLLVDTCDLASGEVRQVIATGSAELREYDVDRALRKLRRYLGPEETSWDTGRFDPHQLGDEAQFVQLQPERLVVKDLSYRPSATAPR